MKTFFANIPLFIEVARLKSFSKAADNLNLSISTLSRNIKTLEKELGCTLFFRDTHNVRLTAIGEILFDKFEDVLNSVNFAVKSLDSEKKQPTGKIKIVMFADIYYIAMRGLFSSFMKKWPGIHLDVFFYEDSDNIPFETYDIIFKIGPLANSSMIAKKLTTISLAPYASPSLLNKYSIPNKPQDLSHIPCISISRMGNFWEMCKDNKTKSIHIYPVSTVNSAIMLLEFIIGGHGVGLLRTELAKPYEKSKKLIRILPDWEVRGHDVYIIVNNNPIPQRISLFVEFMLNNLSKNIDINFIDSLFGVE